MMPRVLRLLVLASIVLSAGCSLFGDEKDRTKGWSAQKLYTEATEALRDYRWEDAIELYGYLEARYPFGRYAQQARLNTAYAHYRHEEPDAAVVAIDRFLKLHPTSPAAAYAQYLKALIYFQNSDGGFISRFIPTDTSQRDAGAARKALTEFQVVIDKYPGTEYARDAHLRLLHLRNNLARYEVHVARYYYERKAYVAAVKRSENVVENYQRSPATEEALEIMAKSYDGLQMADLAEDARRVLALNREQGNFIQDPQIYGEKSWAEAIWDYLELDRN